MYALRQVRKALSFRVNKLRRARFPQRIACGLWSVLDELLDTSVAENVSTICIVVRRSVVTAVSIEFAIIFINKFLVFVDPCALAKRIHSLQRSWGNQAVSAIF